MDFRSARVQKGEKVNDEDCILIVDDNTDNIRLITDYLRESEFKTAFAKDGTVGL